MSSHHHFSFSDMADEWDDDSVSLSSKQKKRNENNSRL